MHPGFRGGGLAQIVLPAVARAMVRRNGDIERSAGVEGCGNLAEQFRGAGIGGYRWGRRRGGEGALVTRAGRRERPPQRDATGERRGAHREAKWDKPLAPVAVGVGGSHFGLLLAQDWRRIEMPDEF